MIRHADCMTCLTTLASGLEDCGGRYTDDRGVVHVVSPTGSFQGLLACEMTNNKWVGWIAKSRTCRVFVRRVGVWHERR